MRGSVSERGIGDQMLLCMGNLRHFEVSHRGGILTLRAALAQTAERHP